ncbi:MAG: YkvA family protein, partial [Anaerolineales bacterium]
AMSSEEKRNLIGPYIPEGNFFREVVQQLKLVYNLMLDQRVHPLTKLIPIVSAAYLIFPLDILPDVAPVLGQLDDLAIVMMGLRFFLELAPAEVVHEHLKRIAAGGNWSVADEPAKPERAPKSAPEGEVVEGSYRIDE